MLGGAEALPIFGPELNCECSNSCLSLFGCSSSDCLDQNQSRTASVKSQNFLGSVPPDPLLECTLGTYFVTQNIAVPQKLKVVYGLEWWRKQVQELKC